MNSSSARPAYKRTIFCLLIITLFTTFCWARSVQLRQPWIVPTFLSDSPHRGTAGTQLAAVNNWLQEGFFKLRFSAYRYPHSVETSTIDKRGFYASYLPGSQYPLYFLFKLLDLTEIVPDIYEKRGMQLLIVIFWNYLLQFLLALMLCISAFVVCRKLGFDNLNATLLALVPAIIQFHNAVSLYWHHLSLFHDISVLLPFASFVFLEILRTTSTSPCVLLIIRVAQPLLIFVGMLVSWVFIFIVLTTYIIRILSKEINLPISLRQGMQWLKQSFLFFIPSVAAVAFWVYQIASHMQRVPQADLATMATSGDRLDLVTNFMFRTGFADGFEHILYYLKNSLFSLLLNGYGVGGVIMLYAVLYMTARRCKFMQNKAGTANLAMKSYLMFFIPCIACYLFFVQNYGDHLFSPILLSPALSLGFVFAPIFILQMMKKNYLMAAAVLVNKKSLTLVALLSLSSSIVYGYSQIYSKKPITKFFSPPAFYHTTIGAFVSKNTDYQDVLFSQDYHNDLSSHDLSVTHFHNKLMHFAANLDWVYYKTKSIAGDHTIKIFYFSYRKQAMQQLADFLAQHDIHTHQLEKEKVGTLLSFDGQQFRIWYEQAHECGTYPQRCQAESSGLNLDLSGHRRLLKW